MKLYKIIKSRNNALYIINAMSLSSISKSLKIYNSDNLRGKFFKLIILIKCFFYSIFLKNKLITKLEIINYLSSFLNINPNLEIGNFSSAMISSGEEKLIILEDQYVYKCKK